MPVPKSRTHFPWARSSSARRVWGFTLLELMFAVGVAAVLSVLAIGQFTKQVDRSKSAAAQAR